MRGIRTLKSDKVGFKAMMRAVRAVVEQLEQRQLLSTTVPTGYVKVNTAPILVSSLSAAPVHTGFLLESGRRYFFVASGTHVLAPDRYADAESFQQTIDGPYVLGPEAHLHVNGVSDWGAIQSDHVYGAAASGDGGELAPWISDSNYADNSGSLSLDVYAQGGERYVDNTSATISGGWASATTTPGFFASDYLHDGNTGKGSKSVTFSAGGLTGKYNVYIRYTSHSNRASNVPVDIIHAGGTTTFTVNQRVNGGQWVLLGRFDLAAGSGVRIRNDGTNGYVVADAVKFSTAQSADQSDWTSEASVSIPVDGSPVMTPVLEAGVEYLLRASGEADIQVTPNCFADAEYANYPTVQDFSAITGVDYGIGIDDATADASKSPHWGVYSGDHVYELRYTGQGRALSLNFHDDFYEDNRGGDLKVEVFRYDPFDVTDVDLPEDSTVDEGDNVTVAYDASAASDWLVKKNGEDYATGGGSPIQFVPDDNGTYDLYISRAGRAPSEPMATILARNVEPTAALHANAAEESGGADVYFDEQHDPSTVDTEAGFLYSFSFNDSDFADPEDVVDISSAHYTGPLPSGATQVWGRIKDKDSGANSYGPVAFMVKPAAPTGLSATAVNESEVNLKWTDNSQIENGYAVYVALAGSESWWLAGLADVNACHYTVVGLAPQTEYQFRVVAYAGGAQSDAAEDSQTTLDYPTEDLGTKSPDIQSGELASWGEQEAGLYRVVYVGGAVKYTPDDEDWGVNDSYVHFMIYNGSYYSPLYAPGVGRRTNWNDPEHKYRSENAAEEASGPGTASVMFWHGTGEIGVYLAGAKEGNSGGVTYGLERLQAVPLVTISVDHSSVAEGQTTNLPKVTFSRYGDTSESLEVHYTVAGTATPAGAGRDYDSPNADGSYSGEYSVTIPAGETSVSVDVRALADELPEGTEWVSVSLWGSEDYRQGYSWWGYGWGWGWGWSYWNGWNYGGWYGGYYGYWGWNWDWWRRATVAITDQPIDLDLIAYRTGANQGLPVSEEDEDSADPTRYSILVNDDYDRSQILDYDDPDDASMAAEPDFNAVYAYLPDGEGGGDDDLAKIVLKKTSSDLSGLTISLSISDLRGVALFRSNGELFYFYRDLADPLYDSAYNSVDLLRASIGDSSYLGQIASADVVLWMECLRPSASMSLTYAVLMPNGTVAGSDDIHFRSLNFAPVALSNLLADGITTIDEDGIPHSAKFRFNLGGVSTADDAASIWVSQDSGGEPTEAVLYGTRSASYFEVYYASEDALPAEPATSQKPAVRLNPDYEDSSLYAELRVGEDRLTRDLAGASKAFLWYAYHHYAFDPAPIEDEEIVTEGESAAPEMMISQAAALSSDELTEDMVDAAEVFAGTRAQDGLGRAMLAYYADIYGAEGQILLKAFLNASNHPESGPRTLCNNRIVIWHFSRLNPSSSTVKTVLNPDESMPNATHIVIDDRLDPARAAEELAARLRDQLTSIHVMNTLRDMLIDKIGEDPNAVNWFRDLFGAALASVARTAENLGNMYYEGVSLVNIGSSLVVGINKLSQGNISGVIECLPVLGKAFAATRLGAGAIFKIQLLGGKVIGGLGTAACKLFGKGCFLPGTLVWTEGGLRPIETIQAGERVRSYDVASATWGFSTVVAPVEFSYQGVQVAIRLDQSVVNTTSGHPVWVVSGEGLADRPLCEDQVGLGQTLTSAGRWVPAQYVRTGDIVLTASGVASEVREVSFEAYDGSVYNLVVEGAHTFAVGAEGLLTHNTACTEEEFQQIVTWWKQGNLVVEETLEDGTVIFRCNGRKVINAERAFKAGQEVTVKLKETGEEIVVPFTSQGFPDFSGFIYQELQAGQKNAVKIVFSGTREADVAMANRLAGFAETPEGYRWHHSEELGEMILVRRDVHEAVGHMGGVAIFRAGMKKLYEMMGEPVPAIYQ